MRTLRLLQRGVLSLVVVLLWAIGASAQVAVDATSTSAAVTANSVTWAHTVTGANPYLLIGCSVLTSETVTGITYNSVAATSIDSGLNAADGKTLAVYGLVAPTTGANNIVASFSGSTGSKRCFGASATGVAQTGSLGTKVKDFYVSVDTGHNHDTTSQTSGMVFDFMLIRDSATNIAVAAGQTQQAKITNLVAMTMIYSTKPGAATTNTGYTWDVAFSEWVHITVPLVPAAAGSAAPLLLLFALSCLLAGFWFHA